MKKIVFISIICVFTSLAFASKKNKHKAQVKQQEIVKPVKPIDKANNMRLCDAPYPQPAWFLEMPKNVKYPANFQMPSAYRFVSTIDTVFSAFLKSIPYDKSNMKIMLPLFINNTIECKEFIISRTQTMDSALQARYPALMSFKAFAADNSLNAARIDCDESSTKMMITFDKKVYYVTSILHNKQQLYLCYAKDDPNFVKDKFEK